MKRPTDDGPRDGDDVSSKRRDAGGLLPPPGMPGPLPMPGGLAPPPGFPGMPPPPSLMGGDSAPPAIAGVGSQDAGQDPRRSLFCGNVSPFVSESLLYHIFSSCGPVAACRIIKDKAGDSARYGFVDFVDHAVASHALQVLNGRVVFGMPIVTKWATGAVNSNANIETHQIYVGNLSPEIDDAALYRAFSAFTTCREARIVRDPDGSSKMYGFVTFTSQRDAEQAMVQMNGEWLGKRPMRINQAHKAGSDQGGDDYGGGGGHGGHSGSTTSEASISAMTDASNTTLYLGGVTIGTTDWEIRKALEDCGRIVSIRVHDGFAFCEMERHEDAVRAIMNRNGCVIGNKTVRIGWSKAAGQRR